MRQLIACFRTLTWGHFLKHKLQYFLLILVVALGVTSFSAIQLVNNSILNHFKKSVYSLTDHQLLPIWSFNQTVPTKLYSDLKIIPGINQIIPIREVRALWQEKQKPVTIRYIDFLELGYATKNNKKTDHKKNWNLLFEQSNTALASPALQQELKRSEKQLSLVHSGKIININIIDTITDQNTTDFVVYQDISWSTQTWEDPKTLSRIEVKVDPVTSKEITNKIKKILPPDVKIGSLAERYDQGVKMISSFQINLTSLAMVSFLVGFFIIYLSLSLAFKQRRNHLSLLLCLGASRKSVLVYLFFESLLLGLIASLLGLGIGIVMAKALLQMVSANISQMYFPVNANLDFSLTQMVLSLSIGISATLLATLEPALQLKSVHISEFLRRDSEEINFGKFTSWYLIVSIVFLILAVCSQSLTSFTRPYFSFLTCLFFILSLLAAVPFCLKIFVDCVTRIIPRNSLLQLQDVQKYLFRYSQVSASLVVAFSLTFAIVDMTSSFRTTVGNWLHDQFQADVFVSPVDRQINPFGSFLDKKSAAQTLARPGIDYSYGFRSKQLPFQGHQINIYTTTIETFFRDKKILRHSTQRSEGITAYVSENFLLRYNLKLGDKITLNFPEPKVVQLIAEFSDYTTENGLLIFSAAQTQNFFPLDRFSAIHLFLEKNISQDEFIKQLKTDLSGQSVQVLSNRDLRNLVLNIFDQTFAVAKALQWLSFLVAFLGLLINMTLVIGARKTTLSILRTQGLSLAQFMKIFLFENIIVMIFTIILSALGGIGLLWILINGIQKYYFSWLLTLSLSPINWFYTFVFVLIALFFMSLFLARKEFKKCPAESIHHE